MPVYFIQDVEQGYIKIGQSEEPEKRLRQLQTGNPNELRLLWVDHQGDYIEAELHREFREHRVSGEWFQPSDELLERIKTSVWSPRFDAQVHDWSIDEDGRGRVNIVACGVSILIDKNKKLVMVTDSSARKTFSSSDMGVKDFEIEDEIEF